MKIPMKDRIGRFRVYIDRSSWYVARANTAMLAIILLKTYGIELTIIEMILLFIITIFVLLVIGYIDVWLGLLSAEQKKYNQENEAVQEILKLLKEKK